MVKDKVSGQLKPMSSMTTSESINSNGHVSSSNDHMDIKTVDEKTATGFLIKLNDGEL